MNVFEAIDCMMSGNVVYNEYAPDVEYSYNKETHQFMEDNTHVFVNNLPTGDYFVGKPKLKYDQLELGLYYKEVDSSNIVMKIDPVNCINSCNLKQCLLIVKKSGHDSWDISQTYCEEVAKESLFKKVNVTFTE